MTKEAPSTRTCWRRGWIHGAAAREEAQEGKTGKDPKTQERSQAKEAQEDKEKGS